MQEHKAGGSAPLMSIFAGLLRHLAGLAAAYVDQAREAIRQETKAAGRRFAFSIALLLMLAIGLTLAAVGGAQIIDQIMEGQGIGFIIVGAAFMLAAIVALLIIMKRSSGEIHNERRITRRNRTQD